MSAVKWTYKYDADPADTTPETLWQVLAAANHRVLLTMIDVMTKGSTGASASLEFDVCVQDDNAGAMSENTDVFAIPPTPAETQQLTVYENDGTDAEPTTSTFVDGFGLHQMNRMLWIPGDGPIEIVGGTRLGCRLLTDGVDYNVIMIAHFEE